MPTEFRPRRAGAGGRRGDGARRLLLALGIAWFLCAQLLIATIVPLELVFEHRNYFASLGVCLAVADLLLLALRGDGARIGALLAVLWLPWLGMTTTLRAREWSDPLRFSHQRGGEALTIPARDLRSRAAAGAGNRLQARLAAAAEAFAALEQARAVPDSGVLPHSALLILAARSNTPSRDEWWNEHDREAAPGPIGAQETSAIASMTKCARDRQCAFPPDAMLAMFQAALGHGQDAEIFNVRPITCSMSAPAGRRCPCGDAPLTCARRNRNTASTSPGC